MSDPGDRAGEWDDQMSGDYCDGYDWAQAGGRDDEGMSPQWREGWADGRDEMVRSAAARGGDGG